MITDDFKPITFTEEYAKKYWDGWQNFLVRQWTYFREGVNVGNEMKYLLATYIFSLWKSDVTIPGWILLWGGLLAVPIIIRVGRWNLIKANLSRQYFLTIQGSLTQFQGHNMSVFQVLLFIEMAKKMGVDISKVEGELQKRLQNPNA